MELKTVANYAKQIGKTPTWVYKLIADKKVKSKKIDGKIFIEAK